MPFFHEISIFQALKQKKNANVYIISDRFSGALSNVIFRNSKFLLDQKIKQKNRKKMTLTK